MKEGRIIKALSGFYYVQSNDHIYTCRGRGVFRKRKVTPLVGDFVQFEVTNDKEGYIIHIKDRKNELTRPPIANVDQAVIVTSAKMPDFNPLLLDRFLVVIESIHVKPVIFVSKMDLVTDDEEQKMHKYKEEYESIGYHVELFSSKEGSNLDFLKHYFHDQITVITGQSGVGKSSILNGLKPELLIKTDEISISLGRGKHTTRYVELLEIGTGLVADTPGFSSLDFDHIELEDLAECFPEMERKKSECRFRGCLHIKEPNCAVKQSVLNGEIKQNRYDNYLTFCEEIQSRKPRYS